MSTHVRVIDTPHGEARLHADRSHRPIAALVLGHGAGGGVESPDLVTLSEALPRRGVSVFRIEQPWRVAGKRVAARPAALDEATVSCVNAIRVRCPMIMGGRSAGARVACRVGRSVGAVGCLLLAFPLLPPGRHGDSRLPELLRAGLPAFVIQGERDAFGNADAFPGSIDITQIPAADHSFRVLKSAEISQTDALARIVDATVTWVTTRVS
ncbi:MAG: alpha/beta hydrolase family protein [Nocardioidaceae bacterium]